jgi:hypothetical protein
MRITFSWYRLLIFSGFCLLLNSCLEVACIDETEAFVKAGFYSYSTKKQIIPDSLTLYGINMQAKKIYSKAKLTPPALIPLRDSTDNSTFIIKINGVTDTIEFLYWSYPHLVTKECGYSTYHTLDTVYHTRHAIDSIAKINENITTLNAENISIYY